MSSWQAGVDPDEMRDDLQSDRIHRLRGGFRSPDQSNIAGVRDRVIDAAFARGGRTFDSKVRSANYDRVQQRVIKEAYWKPLYYDPNIITVDRHASGVASTAHVPDEFAWMAFNWRYKP